jgi:hypothetical protein
MATCFEEMSDDGTINGTSDTEMVPAPPTGTRRIIKSFSIRSDEVTNLTVALKNGSDKRVLWGGKIFKRDSLLFGDGNTVIVLDSPDKSLVAFLDGVVATPLDFVVSWGDATG